MKATRAGKASPRVSPACARAMASLWAYLDGELGRARTRSVADHLRDCSSCASNARQLRSLLEACRAAGCGALPGPVAARARARVTALVGSNDGAARGVRVRPPKRSV
jgi:anti-sigma factor RsiW